MNTILYQAQDRGFADQGWLKSNHSFSFDTWYRPDRNNFGALRVLNDDVVAPGKGFPLHPHDNMEIISIPIDGELKHQDDMGNEIKIGHGEIQIMSTGKGVRHGEYNASDTESVNFLQIWIYPKYKDIDPRYAQTGYDEEDLKDSVKLLIAPEANGAPLDINQDAYVSLAKPGAGSDLEYSLKMPGYNGVYVFLIDGVAQIAGKNMKKRDALAVTDAEHIKVKSDTDSFLLFIEVPMNYQE